ncbi:hypothetical protein J5N97_015388 [Dioscorea zingiberensis]|uniref:Trichome birefringence-like N-terminal domain-containing protein n=1 Tax=Dioscorea zingiberensis TaxID=325984 RepID=A0A9D5CVL8_9LILI|nr:hypothetical protein J5N97_015388 [Dioscorea zingiberensis]
MERQGSFSIKPSRLVFLSFTISSSLLFCFIFSFRFLTTYPSVSTETHLQFSNGLQSLKAQPFAFSKGSLFAGTAKNPVLVTAHLNSTAEISGKDGILGGVSSGGAGDVARNDSNLGRKTATLADLLELKNKKVKPSDGVRNGSSESSSTKEAALIVEEKAKEVGSTCDVSDGKWVYDSSYPLYANNSCPFIDEGFSCETNGRLDKEYLKWRWQPNGCNIPRFNPVEMLELIRGKRLVFVGDSINRNQWESMLCMLRGAISDPRRVYEARGRRITKERGNYNFKFVDYHCSVEYYVTHFLVHESKARVGQKRVKTLRIDTIDRSSSKWRGADILVFNTAHWWSHYKTKAGVNYYQEGDRVHPRLDASFAFRKALMTWASWVDQHVNPVKTRVFFRSSSPSHFRGGEWNSGGHCQESTRPLNDTSKRAMSEKNMIVEEVVKQMKTPVTILNITNLSGLRIDGHPSIYGRKPGKGLRSNVQDCSHWCLPGVPDTWNEILYFHLLSQQKLVLTS